MMALSFGLGTLLATVAGGLIATFFPFTILYGNTYQLKSFVIVVLGFFYAFRGTPQQALVFQAEGNLADFAQSGMQDLKVFIMEDFLGAVFYHSLLLPIVATLLSLVGSLLGIGLARLITPNPSSQPR